MHRCEEREPVAIESGQQRVLGISVDDVRSVSLDRTIHATGHVLMAPPVRMPAPEAGSGGPRNLYRSRLEWLDPLCRARVRLFRSFSHVQARTRTTCERS
jgi:hypothetical protein